jgi:hypothetical protein
MGCSDSSAIDNHMNLRNQTVALNPHEFPHDSTDTFLSPSDIKMRSKDSQINGLKKQSSQL